MTWTELLILAVLCPLHHHFLGRLVLPPSLYRTSPACSRMRPDDASVADDSAPRDGASGGFRLGLGHGAFVEGGVVSEDSGSRAEDWRRRSVDAHIQRTVELASARRAAAISASASSAVATDSATSSPLAATGFLQGPPRPLDVHP